VGGLLDEAPQPRRDRDDDHERRVVANVLTNVAPARLYGTVPYPRARPRFANSLVHSTDYGSAPSMIHAAIKARCSAESGSRPKGMGDPAPLHPQPMGCGVL